MNMIENVSLADKTTFKIGGTAVHFYIPESVEELIEIINRIGEEDYYILSGGSNILINDRKSFDHVISMKNIDNKMEILDHNNGLFYFGASCHIQKVIRYINDCGYGGFEELIGLPALLGGVVYMNAGIGGRHNTRFNISDYIVSVKCLDKKKREIIWKDNDSCEFSYRRSVFMNDEYVILGAELKCSLQQREISEERIKKRLLYCRNNQVWDKGCFGSCFSNYNKRILKVVCILMKRVNRGIVIGKNNPNWITNNGKATFSETIRYIKLCEKASRLFRREIEREIQVWE